MMATAVFLIMFLPFTFVTGKSSNPPNDRITSSPNDSNGTEIMVSSSFFDITLQPTFTSFDRPTLDIIHDTTQSFLLGSLSTAFGGSSSPQLEHLTVNLHSMTFTMDDFNRLLYEMRRTQNEEEIFSSTTITFSTEANFYTEKENDPDFAEYIDMLILASFGTISGIKNFQKLLSASGSQILKEIDDVIVVPTNPPFPIEKRSQAKGDANKNTVQVKESPSQQNSGSNSSVWKNSISPVDILFVVISGLILTAVVFVIWNENRKRNVPREDRLGYFPSSRPQNAPSIVITSNEAPQISFRTVETNGAKFDQNDKSKIVHLETKPKNSQLSINPATASCDVGYESSGAIHSPPLRRHLNSSLRYKKLQRVAKSDKNSLTSEESSSDDRRDDDNSVLGSIPENKELPSDFGSQLVVDKSDDSDDVFQVGSVDSSSCTDRSAPSWHDWTRGVQVEYSKTFKSSSSTKSCVTV